MEDNEIKQLEHIPTSEILQDINDTQKEIDQYEKELDSLLENRSENKLDIYMREGKVSTRKDFVKKLNSIIDYRNKQTK